MLVIGLLLQACQTYEKKPVDLKKFQSQWENRLNSLRDEDLKKFANDLFEQKKIPQNFNIDDGVTFEEAKLISWLYNPELKKIRLAAKTSAIEKDSYQFFPNPNLNLEFEPTSKQGVSGIDKDWLLTSKLGFTFPLSFISSTYLQGLDAKSQYKLFEIIQAERKNEQALLALWNKCFVIKKKQELLNHHIDNLQKFFSQIESLELSSIDFQTLNIDILEHQIEQIDLKIEHQNYHNKIMRLLGLKADTQLNFNFSLPLKDLLSNTQQQLVNNNIEIQLAKIHYSIAENNLKLEIQKQYPDLTLSPIKIQGESHLGLGLELVLPFFNKNKKAISLAYLERELAANQLKSTLQEQTNLSVQLHSKLKLIEQKEEYFIKRFSPLLEQQVDNIRGSLHEHDSGVLMLKEILTRNLQTKMNIIELMSEKAHTVYLLNNLIKSLPTGEQLPYPNEFEGE